ncbi:MAG: lysine--tRNA ligase [Candidatus Harrisonbacteria bacterium]|nr:lysine--tRNA ligase [Candidatus Harrisonbacteria bacterium]
MSSLEHLREDRLKKRKLLEQAGKDPYPQKSSRTAPIAEILKDWNRYKKSARSLTVAGRIFAQRGQGGILFLDMKDESGSIQAVLNKKSTHHFDRASSSIDIGDFVQVRGKAFLTKRGEKSIDVVKLDMLAKALRPIPSQWYGVTDSETRYRQRYLDLIVNDDLKDLFRKKTVFWSSIRSFLVEEGFLEVETPVLELVPGGADAEPFTTHHNALGTEMYLRISLEIALKKLIISGFEKVFEIGRIFRNEGISPEHLQDYTQMEMYWAYQDYTGLMKLMEKMYKYVIKATTGGLKTKRGAQTINWAKKWETIDYYTFFKQQTKIDLEKASDSELRAFAKKRGLDEKKHPGRGRIIDLIFKQYRHKIIGPAFLINPPVDIEPLAKRTESGSDQVARFQIMAAGTELGKGFSELNDPLDQRQRFLDQQKLREAGDKEAQRLDEDFIEAMEYGMPPTAGFGLSERLFAVIMDKPVRETVFFPNIKARSKDKKRK